MWKFIQTMKRLNTTVIGKEEYNKQLLYKPGMKNIVADALPRSLKTKQIK